MEIKEKLNGSLEVSTIRLNIKVELGMVALVCGLHFLTTLLNPRSFQDVNPWAFYGLIAGIVLVPLLGVHLWEFRRIYKNWEAYRFYETKLTQPHGSWFRSMYFTVLLRDDEGTVITRTHSIFGTSKYQWGPIMEDYLNQTVTVAYNEETEQIVVIG